MLYNSACIERLRTLLFTLYIHSLCASRRAELANCGQRRWAVYYTIFIKSNINKTLSHQNNIQIHQ